MKTIGSKLDQFKGIGPGFDFLRIFLAMSVLLTHSVLTVQGEKLQFSHVPLQLWHDSILPMFFALSGFLIAGSALRLNIKDFILNRALRIVPALSVDILLSALIIGPIFTTETVSDYLSAHEFKIYFMNVIGWIHYSLPGVFITNPASGIVNGSLWTIPFEIGCYIIMSALIALNFLKRRIVTLGISICVATLLALSFMPGALPHPDAERLANVPKIFEPFILERGQGLYVYFLLGALFYLYRYVIAYNNFIFTACVAAFIFGTCGGLHNIAPQLQIFLYVPVIVYMTVFIGLMRIPKIPFFASGDYSYGIYLYGYPIQQALVVLFPHIQSIWLHFALSVVITTMMAYVSWHFIEKPILRLRRMFSFTARKGDREIAMPDVAQQQLFDSTSGTLRIRP